jgi:hypothetical protein
MDMEIIVEVYAYLFSLNSIRITTKFPILLKMKSK